MMVVNILKSVAMRRPSKITPMFNHILVTADRYEDDKKNASGLILETAGGLKEIQKIVAVGSSVRGLKEGDYVQINPTRYIRDTNSLKDVGKSKAELHFEFPVVEVGGKPYLFLYDSDIDFIIDAWEEVSDSEKKSPLLYAPPKATILEV